MTESASPARIARFGVFDLDPRTGELRKRGVRVHLQDHPFDVRRAYVGSGVAAKLVDATLLHRAARARQFHFGSAEPSSTAGPAHAVFVAGR